MSNMVVFKLRHKETELFYQPQQRGVQYLNSWEGV